MPTYAKTTKYQRMPQSLHPPPGVQRSVERLDQAPAAQPARLQRRQHTQQLRRPQAAQVRLEGTQAQLQGAGGSEGAGCEQSQAQQEIHAGTA